MIGIGDRSVCNYTYAELFINRFTHILRYVYVILLIGLSLSISEDWVQLERTKLVHSDLVLRSKMVQHYFMISLIFTIILYTANLFDTVTGM